MQTPQERADKLSRFHPEARQPLLGLLSTPNFKSQNLMKLEEPNHFFLACSDIVPRAGETRFRCALSGDGSNVCGVAFDRRDRFADHLHQHLDMEPYQCECNVEPCIPPKVFATRALLDNHHHGNKRKECSYCQAIVVTKNMVRHQGSMLCIAAQEAAQQAAQSSSTA